MSVLCLGLLLWICLAHLFFRLVPGCCLLTCMSRASSTESATVDLSLTLPCGLRVSITGPSSSSGLAASLLQHVAAFEPDLSAPSEFELVSSVPDSPVAAPSRPLGLETRDQVRRSLLPCPPSLFVLGTRLCGSSLSGRDRVHRAWICGQQQCATPESAAQIGHHLLTSGTGSTQSCVQKAWRGPPSSRARLGTGAASAPCPTLSPSHRVSQVRLRPDLPAGSRNH